MDIRQATTNDIEGIRRVARRSLSASYDFLEGDVLESAVEQWYAEEVLEDLFASGGQMIIVGTIDGEVVGFSQSTVVGADESVGEIRWIHVDPDYRDQGVGRELLERTDDVLDSAGVDRIRGVVLEGNESGTEFYETHGFELAGDREIEIAGETHTELAYETEGRAMPSLGEDVERRTVDGEQLYVFYDEGDRGSKGMFFPAYRSEDRDTLVAWVCECGSTDNAMDTMGRLECNECGNVRKPTRWDAAYL